MRPETGKIEEGNGAAREAANAAATMEGARQRAAVYSIFSCLLSYPPDQECLEVAKSLSDYLPACRVAFSELSAAAGQVSPDEAAKEFHELFSGRDEERMLPYGSWYLSGELYAEPLARLRMEMPSLGIARSENLGEAEDHVASLFVMMSGLILGCYRGVPARKELQASFFARHIYSWAPDFFADLQGRQSAPFYSLAGKAAATFILAEAAFFGLE